MRPQEILGMVEEAAGTRMFEDRKENANKTMGKKEKRVAEIASILAEEIIPKLDKLRAEKKAFMDWSRACAELERIDKVLRAHEWTEGQHQIGSKTQDIITRNESVKVVEKEKSRAVKESANAEAQLLEVQAKRQAEMAKTAKLKKQGEAVADLEKQLVKVRTQHELKTTTIRKDEEELIEKETALRQVRRTRFRNRVVSELN